MFEWYGRFANLWTFLIIFCLCFLLETIIFTYLFNVLMSIEHQFEIPSRQSATLASAGDIGYIIFVVILSYFGSKGNRARWIGGGCILVSLACILVALPNFIFTDRTAIDPKGNFVYDAVIPPQHLLEPNVSVRELLRYPPLRRKIPPHVIQQILDKAYPPPPSKGGLLGGILGDGDYEDYYAEQEAVKTNSASKNPARFRRQSANLTEAEEKEKMRALIFAMAIGEKPYTAVIEAFQDRLKKPAPKDIIERVQRGVGMPFGTCQAVVGRMIEKIQKLKCENKTNKAAYGILFFGILLIGVGYSMPWTLGIPLLDDNVSKRNAPFYFVGIYMIRLLGPLFGWYIGWACNRTNFDAPLGMTALDLRWLGVWWIGYLVFAVMLIPAILLFCFPDPSKKRKTENGHEKEEIARQNRAEKEGRKKELHLINKHKKDKADKPSVVADARNFFGSLVQILWCPVYTGAIIARLFEAFALKGYSAFVPTYVESHYGIPYIKIRLLLPILGVAGFVVGVPLGSVIMRIFKLEGRRAAFYVAMCSLICSILSFSNIALGCTSAASTVAQQGIQNDFNFTTSCNEECYCEPVGLFPVCDMNGTAYHSPCVAGCANTTIIDRTSFKFEFRECECIKHGDIVSRDFCQDDCGGVLKVYFALMIIAALIGGTAVIPGILIILRSVPPEHRSLALGFGGFILCLAGTLPSPVAYGAIVDSACLFSNKDCGGKGSCAIYDPSKLRSRVHIFEGALFLVAVAFDLWVCYWAKNLKLMEEEPATHEEDHVVKVDPDGHQQDQEKKMTEMKQ